jgi:hypothetical protein
MFNMINDQRGRNMASEPSHNQFRSKAETIQQLRETISQLEKIIQELNTIDVKQLPEASSLETLGKTTAELENAISALPRRKAIAKTKEAPPTATAATTVSETPAPPEIAIAKDKQASPPTVETPETVTPSDPLVEKPTETPTPEKTDAVAVTAQPPQPPQTQRKKWLIIGILAAIAIALIPLGLKFLPTESVAVVKAPPAEIIAESPQVPEAIESAPELDSQTTTDTKPQQPEISELPEVVTPEITPEPELVTPEVVATKTNQTASSPEIAPVTPEQNLIAAIAKKVNNLTTSSEPELITAIEADLNYSKLLITFDPQWYNLNSDRQDRVSQEILKRSRQLEFAKLIIQDNQGKAIARNPVVGNNMVIFQRTSQL